MKTTTEQHNQKKQEIMQKCFECYAENGLNGTGIKALAAACGFTQANLYSYFQNLDDLIIDLHLAPFFSRSETEVSWCRRQLRGIYIRF